MGKSKVEIPWRYSTLGDRYTLNSYGGISHHDPTIHLYTGPVGSEPEWARNILLMARLGDHEVVIEVPPPNMYVWFTTDGEYNLLGFPDTPGIP